MEIREITGDKRRYLPLLLVGDEQEEMVMRYLPHGSLFVCFDPDPCAVAVVTDEGDGCCELKNLAVEPCPAGRIPDFFTRNYDHPIVEEGVLLRDMILLEQPLGTE